MWHLSYEGQRGGPRESREYLFFFIKKTTRNVLARRKSQVIWTSAGSESRSVSFLCQEVISFKLGQIKTLEYTKDNLFLTSHYY